MIPIGLFREQYIEEEALAIISMLQETTLIIAEKERKNE